MEAGEREHPLRADPLQALPDVVQVPRRPRQRLKSPSSGSLSDHDSASAAASTTTSRPLSPALAPSSHDKHVFEMEALERFRDAPPDDPLLAAVLENAQPPADPPASGTAYATDVEALLSAVDDMHRGYDDYAATVGGGVLATAGVATRTDVTVLPAASKEGEAAGVYIVKSRRNRKPSGVGSDATASSSASTAPSHSAADYVRARRSIADFTWLRRRLCARYDGVIVPSLPAMALAGRLTHGYAHDIERRRGLQRFLRRVATHPVLAVGDEVFAFLGTAGDDAWRKLRREPLPPEGAVADALFGAARPGVEDDGPLRRVGMWGEKFLWQTGKRVNQGLVWLLDRDRGVAAPANAEDSAKVRLERLQNYVRGLGVTLITLRGVIARISKNRTSEIQSARHLQDALRALAHGEGGKFATYMGNIVLDVDKMDSTPPSNDLSVLAAATATVTNTVNETSTTHQEASNNTGVNADTTDKSDGNPEANSSSDVNPTSDVNSDRGAPMAAEIHTDDITAEDEAALDDVVTLGAGSAAAAHALDEVIRDYEERVRGAQRIMAARQEEQEAFERALSVYKRLRDRLESRADSMWEPSRSTSSQSLMDPSSSTRIEHKAGFDNLVDQVNAARDRLTDVRKHYQAIALRTTDELRRLRAEMHDDICIGLESLAREVVREHALHASSWAELAQSLSAYRETQQGRR